jgi:hypothetical protein
MFEYACNRRHPDAGGAPPGYLQRAADNEAGKYGTVGYEEPLDAEKVSRYGMRIVNGPSGQWAVSGVVVASGERIHLATYHGTVASAYFRAQKEAVHRGLVVKDLDMEWVAR